MATANQTVHDPFETALLKAAIQQNLEWIAGNIQSQEFRVGLTSRNIISMKESEHLSKEGDTKGSTFQAELALRYVLGKPAEQVWESMEVLESGQSVVYQRILETIKQIKAGKVKLTQDYDEDPKSTAVSVATILLYDGQAILQQKLKREVLESKYRNISKALKEKEDVIRQYRDGRCGKPQSVLKSQFQKLFPKKGVNFSLEALDLTLVTFLFRAFFDVSAVEKGGILPEEDDSSLPGHLARLLFVRNWCYANFLNPKAIKRKILPHLEKALLGLGGKQNRRLYWRLVMLHPDKTLEKDLKESINSLISSDINDIQIMVSILEKMVKTSNMEGKGDIEKKIHSLQTDFTGHREQIFSILGFLPVELMNAALLHLDKPAPESPNIIVQKMQSCIEQFSGHIESQLKENQKQMKQHIDRKTDTSEGQRTVSTKGRFSQLRQEVQERLVKSEVFKVLVLSQPAEHDHDDLEELCFAIGNVPWDILIDLDYKSRTDDGLHDKIIRIFKTIKDYQVVTYNQVQIITDADESIIANGEKMLWLLANGCADTGVKSLNKSTKVKALAPLELVLSSIFSKFPGRKALTCLDIILADSDNVPGIGRQILKRISDCCIESEEFIDIDNSQVYSIYTRESDENLVSEVSLEHHQMCLTHLDTARLVSEKVFSNPKAKTYIYPGDEKRECHMTADRMAQYQVYIALYHRDIGQLNFENERETEIEEVIEKERRSFLKGQPLTPEAQFLQGTSQMFVVRTEMENARKRVETILKEREEWHKKGSSVHFTIRHDSSGGGTTTARYLLYSLRNTYPCMEVRRIDVQTTKILNKIFKESKKPLLIVMDNHDFTDKSADELQNELSNDYVKALVVYVGRKKVDDAKQSQGVEQVENCVEENHSIYRPEDDDIIDESCEEVSNSIYIPSKLEPLDKEGFRQLYEKLETKIRASRVILYGLLAFCDKYDRGRLNEHISEWFKTSTIEQKQALSVVIFVWKYCQRPIKAKLLGRQTSDSNHEVLWKQLFGYYGNDFVKTDKNDPFSACPVNACIIEPIIEKLEDLLECPDKRLGMLEWFTANLYDLLSQCDLDIDEIAMVTKTLFTERPKGAYFSVLLTEIKDICGKEFAANQILKFTSLWKGSRQEGHMRALYARYLTYCMNKTDEGLHEITVAVGLKEGEDVMSKHTTKEPAILATYGYLYRDKAQSVFENSVKLNTHVALQKSVPLFTKAINAFEKAQMATMDSKRYKVDPFLGEVKVRYRILVLCFNHCCKRKFEEFRKFLKETPYDIIKESEKRAMSVLDKVDNLERLNKLDELSVQTSRAIVRFKFRILRFHFDERKTKRQLINSVKMDKDLSIDIGLLIRLQYDKIQSVEEEGFLDRLRNWSDLRNDELITIIEYVRSKLELKSPRVLLTNFADILNAMIQIRYNDFSENQGMQGSYDNYSLGYAIFCAEQWDIQFPKDQRALFYLGALKLVQGLEEQNDKIIKEGVDLLNKTDEICKENPSAKDLKARTFAIGKGSGLSKLVPYKKDLPIYELSSFEGRQVTPRSAIIGVNPYQQLLRAKMYRDDSSNIGDGQQSKLRFCICLRQKFPIVAFNVEKI